MTPHPCYLTHPMKNSTLHRWHRFVALALIEAGLLFGVPHFNHVEPHTPLVLMSRPHDPAEPPKPPSAVG